MRLQVKQFLTLTRMTALEAVRQPISLLLVATCVVAIALLPLLITHTMGEDGKLVRDSALALHLVCGLLLGAYAACAALTREIRSGTAAAVLSKPVGRATFFLAKYCGIAVLMLLFSIAATLTTLLSARAGAGSFAVDWWAAGPLLVAVPASFLLAGLMNYFTRRPFVSGAFGLLLFALGAAFITAGLLDTEGRLARFGAALPWRLVPASALIALAVLVLAAIAACLATRLDTVPILAICGILLMLGLVSDYLFGRHAAGNRAVALVYAALPNWQNFWTADALTDGGVIPWGYVARAGAYAAFYLAGLLGLGMLLIRRIEIK